MASKVKKDSMHNFINVINVINWESILCNNNPNDSYDKFIEFFMKSYNKHCPTKRVKYKNGTPADRWMTSGLRNVCKKKNKLYQS